MLFGEDAVHKHNENSDLDSQPAQLENDFFGPALPPYLLKKKDCAESQGKEKIYGPTLPDYFRPNEEKVHEIKQLHLPEESAALIGPALPEQLSCTQSESSNVDEECDSFGPSADLMASEDVTSPYKFINMPTLRKKTSEDLPIKRETWMTELPEKRKANFALLPRHFKSQVTTEKEGDASVWTDTPADKEKKNTLKKDHTESLKMKRLQERDKEMEKLAKKAARKLRKKKSLMEIHLKKKKKKEEKEAKKLKEKGKNVPERRPFDRNIDLQVKKFDENQRRAILNKSHFLNDRFAPGQSKFL